MKLHPVHPMLVHAPLAGWIFVPACDLLAVAMDRAFFSQAAALISAFALLGAAAAATFGALDLPRARERAAKLATTHAVLMGAAVLLSGASLFGRIDGAYAAITPTPLWAIAASALALVVALAGAWCGGEMVYGRGVGVDRS